MNSCINPSSSQYFWEISSFGEKEAIIISLLRDLGKMSEENTHNECKFLGHERPLGLEWPKNLHEWWVFPTNFPKSQGREWYLFHNDVFPNSCEENEWGKQSLEWRKFCQNDTKNSSSKLRISVKIQFSLKLNFFPQNSRNFLQNSEFFLKTEIFLSKTQKIWPKTQFFGISKLHSLREMTEKGRLP